MRWRRAPIACKCQHPLSSTLTVSVRNVNVSDKNLICVTSWPDFYEELIEFNVLCPHNTCTCIPVPSCTIVIRGDSPLVNLQGLNIMLSQKGNTKPSASTTWQPWTSPLCLLLPIALHGMKKWARGTANTPLQSNLVTYPLRQAGIGRVSSSGRGGGGLPPPKRINGCYATLYRVPYSRKFLRSKTFAEWRSQSFLGFYFRVQSALTTIPPSTWPRLLPVILVSGRSERVHHRGDGTWLPCLSWEMDRCCWGRAIVYERDR